ncbi:major capsid family protein [Nitratireductor sp. PBL-C9]|uniref:major capsid family protein n=1 Tax=Nitratireductor sp. PBL-C9 TaxID=3435013 RepID=UPI003D7CD4E2
MNMQITDAQGLAFLRQQTHVLSNRAFEQEYDLINWRELVPINTDYPEWASGVDFQIGDMTGAAQWQSGYSKDVPLADVRLISVGIDFAMYAVGYRYNVEEVGKAQFAGYPLTARKAIAARQAADIFCAETALYGGGHPGWSGLTNMTGVTPTASPDNGTGSARNWVDANGVGQKTAEQIVAELNRLLMGPASATGIMTSLIGNTILLPPLAYQYIATTPYGVTSPDKTILQYFEANNIYTSRTGQPVVVREQPFLAGAATLDTPNLAGQGRAVGYRNSPDALELPMPMTYRFLDVHQDGPLQWAIPGIGRVGQLVQIRDTIRYVDGVSPAPPAA